jgi:hypothetical protein
MRVGYSVAYLHSLNNCILVNKQLNDKERVAAALENPNLLELIEQCLAGTDASLTQ